MSFEPPARVLIVDDHPLIRAGLCQLINAEKNFTVCGEAEGVASALTLVAATEPHLMVVDISLKDGNGIELVKQIKAIREEVKILVSSRHEEALFAERALHAGASGYVNKEVAAENVVEALNTILKGKVYVSEAMSDRLLQGLANSEKDRAKSPVERLSDRELEIFELIGEGCSTREIADKLHLSVKTIETHRESIKRKMNLESGNELTRAAVQWVLEQG
jgi:DNA-binding NarL/FixJ family response regulator